MKSLVADAATSADKPYWDVAFLLKLEFTDPDSLTLRYTDRLFGTRNYIGTNHWEPLILEWGVIRSGEIVRGNYATRPGDCVVYIDNNRPTGGYDRFSGVLKNYTWAYITATIYAYFVGNASGSEIEIFKGQVEVPEVMTKERVALRISDLALGLMKKWDHEICNDTTYADADPDDLGKMFPQVWGECKKVPLLAVDAGWLTTLAEDLTDSDTTITLTDASGLPSSGTIQIDTEQITYSSKTGNNLTVTRSDGVEHDLGAKVAEIQTNYTYALGHAVKAIDAVYVDNVKQPAANYTAYTGQSGDQHGTFTDRAIVEFSTLPILKKQINIDFDISLSVDGSEFDVDEGAHLHGTTLNYTTYPSYPGSYVNCNWAESGPVINACGADLANWAEMNKNSELYLHFSANPGFGGTIDQVRVVTYASFSLSAPSSSTYFRTRYIANGVQQISDTLTECNVLADSVGVSDSDWQDVNGVVTWEDVGSSYLHIYHVTGDEVGTSNVFQLRMIELYIRYTPPGATYSTEVTLSGTVASTDTLTGNSVADTVIGGMVAVDVDGFQDDGAGTYTGTPDALIEEPQDVFEHMIIDRLGQSASEIDSTTYSASETAYAVNSWTLNVVLLEPPDVMALFAEMAQQCKSLQFWEAGVHHLKYLEETPSSVKTLDGNRITLDQIYLDFSLRTEIRNKITGTYDRWWSGKGVIDELSRNIKVAEDSSSQSKYGTIQARYQFPFIDIGGQATYIVEWLRNRLKEPALLVNIMADPFCIDVERGDIANFDLDNVKDFTSVEQDTWGDSDAWGDSDVWYSTEPIEVEPELKSALLGLVPDTDMKFMVIDVNYQPSGLIQLKMEEVKTDGVYSL